MACVLILVNISMMVEHTKSIENRGGNHTPVGHRKAVEKSNDDGAADSKSTGGESTGQTDGKIDEKLLRILRHVGINSAAQLTDQELSLLPTWDQVVEKFGDNGPVVHGLDTCSVYRSKVPAKKRKLAVAGPFSSGTHFLFDILDNNCKGRFKKFPKAKAKNPNVLFQVPWGKHQSANFRLVHNTDISHSIKNENEYQKDPITGQLKHPPMPDHLLEHNKNILPIVVVRDPYTWWQSMCRVRYSTHWYHIVPDHCPNFVPNHVEKEWFNKPRKEVRDHYHDAWKIDNVLNKANFTLDKKVVPVWVKYHSENRKHASLAHMWADWYSDYYEADFPRLMIRLEDLVFYPHETLKTICECANEDGDTEDSRAFEYVGDENLEMSLDSAIGGSGKMVDSIHGKERTGLLGAMKKHAGHFADEHRLTGMTTADLDFAEAVLKDSAIWKAMKYTLPRRPE